MGMSHMESAAIATPSVSFALTKHPSRDGREAIVLHLYRDVVPVVTKTIAVVEPSKTEALLRECRRHLETLGVESIAYRAMTDPRLVAGDLSRVRLAH